jgi:hypothetical protein
MNVGGSLKEKLANKGLLTFNSRKQQITMITILLFVLLLIV